MNSTIVCWLIIRMWKEPLPIFKSPKIYVFSNNYFIHELFSLRFKSKFIEIFSSITNACRTVASTCIIFNP